MKKILILGGTSFVGKNIAEFLIAQPQFEVTLFNRGVTNPDIFQKANKIIGDRNNRMDIKKIFKKKWNYIIDVSCYYPHQLNYLLQGDLNNLSNYLFISTCSVYDNEQCKIELRNEDARILDCTSSQEKDVSLGTYGNRKAACERYLIKSGIPYTILRPALIYGKYDPTDRLYYWLYQVKKEQEAILPENGNRKFSITYINDLVKAISRILELQIKNQTFNCISNPSISIAKIIDICETEYQRRIKRISVSVEFLKENKIQQWTDIPLWLNSDFYTYSNKKMLDMLSFKTTDLVSGIKETINYYNQLGYKLPIFGINEKKKSELIDEFFQG